MTREEARETLAEIGFAWAEQASDEQPELDDEAALSAFEAESAAGRRDLINAILDPECLGSREARETLQREYHRRWRELHAR